MANGSSIDPTVFRQMENTVSDLRRAQSSSFERHIRRLAQLLRAPGLEPITEDLARDIDVEAWIAQGKSNSSMVGSGRLEWPSDKKKELGTTIKLIDRFAENPQSALDFTMNFYYAGNNYSRNLQNLAEQIFVPFVRDYIDYLGSTVGTHETGAPPEKALPAAQKVFVVHGHDEGARDAVARFLERIGLEAIILHEQPNRGLTIIEKFEAYAAQVGFAVVLLTPDDLGGPQAADARMPRARQNVIFELGYFAGRIGRGKVCLLRKGEIEGFSDFNGVVYTAMDAGGGWKLELARELKAAGLDVDLNKALGA